MILDDSLLFKGTFFVIAFLNVVVVPIGTGSWDDQCVQRYLQDNRAQQPGVNLCK